MTRLSPALVEQAAEFFVAERVVVRLEEDVGGVFWAEKKLKFRSGK